MFPANTLLTLWAKNLAKPDMLSLMLSELVLAVELPVTKTTVHLWAVNFCPVAAQFPLVGEALATLVARQSGQWPWSPLWRWFRNSESSDADKLA